jgi:hypothetical protein
MWIDACEMGRKLGPPSPRHPKRELHELHYASAAFLTNCRKLQEMLNEICAINAELLRRRESLD